MLLEARKRELVVMRADEGEDAPPEIIDLGNVGQVTRVNTALIHSLIRDGFVPVIAPVGVDGEGRTYNINADAVAGAVAGALRAKRLLMLTDVAGLMDRTGELITDLTAARAKALQGDGTISGGMIPKVECCPAFRHAGFTPPSELDAASQLRLPRRREASRLQPRPARPKRSIS